MAQPTPPRPPRWQQSTATPAAASSATPSIAASPSSSTPASGMRATNSVAVTDADTHMHPLALKLLVARICRSPLVAAVAGAPHVTNRGRFLLAMQTLEAASIIGLIRRTQSLTGRVGVVAGVLALFRRERVLAVGGFDPRMATEDIDLTWKLLLAGWQTAYEPRALVGMQVPASLRALWMQRKRWARGQGEVLHVHFSEASRWRNRRMWLLSVEGLASLVWVLALFASLVFAAFGVLLDRRREPLRVRVRVGDRDLLRSNPPDDRRAHPRTELRPQHLPRHSSSGPSTRSRSGSSPRQPHCTPKSSPSYAGRPATASSGTSPANTSTDSSPPRKQTSLSP